jgi:hypothetical protein
MTKLLTKLLTLILFCVAPVFAQTIVAGNASVAGTATIAGAAAAASAPVFVTGGFANNGTSTCAVTLSVTNGQLFIGASGSNSLPTNTLTIADTDGDSFSQVASSPYTFGTTVIAAGWTSTLAHTNAAEVFTFTFTNSTNFNSCAGLLYTNPGAVDQGFAGANNTAVTGTNALVSGTTGTTTQANELVVGLWVGSNSGVNIAAGTGFTLRAPNTAATAVTTLIEDKTVSATGTQSATMTAAGGVNQTGALITFTVK